MLTRATLATRNLKNGWNLIEDDVPLGKVYYVDLSRVVKLTLERDDYPEIQVALDCVMTYDEPQGGDYGGYMPLSVLHIEPNA